MNAAQKGSLSAHTNAVATCASGDDGGAPRRAPRRRRRRRVAAAAARAPVRRRRRRRRRRARARAGPLRRRVVVPRDLGPAVLPGRRQKSLRASAARPGGRALPRRQRPRPARRTPPPPRRRRRRHARALPARRGAGGARAADRGGAREGRRPELRRRAHLARAHEEHRAQGELAPGEGRGDGAERRRVGVCEADRRRGERRPPREGAPRAHRDPVAVRRLGQLPAGLRVRASAARRRRRHDR